MDSARIRRGGVRLFGRILLCAAAIAGGAALAHTTRPHAPTSARSDAANTHATEAATPAARQRRTPAEQIATPAPLPSEAELIAVDIPRDTLGANVARGMTITGATPHRLILFTFDDGPDRSTTPKLLDRLDAAGVRAVFFLSGSRILGENKQQRDQQEVARDAVRRGHIVASHTINHVALPMLDSEEVIAQVEGNEEIFERVFGARPWLFRPPFGVHTDRTDGLMQDRGYTIMLWNRSTGDFQVRTAEAVHTTWRRVFERREREDG